MLDVDTRELTINAYMEPHKEVYPFYGWAPGMYTCRSIVSGTRFLGAKGSVRTLPEAMTAAKEHAEYLGKLSHEYGDAKIKHRREIEALNATIMSQALEIQQLKDIP